MCFRKLIAILNKFKVRLNYFNFYKAILLINYGIVYSLFKNHFVLLKNSNEEVILWKKL